MVYLFNTLFKPKRSLNRAFFVGIIDEKNIGDIVRGINRDCRITHLEELQPEEQVRELFYGQFVGNFLESTEENGTCIVYLRRIVDKNRYDLPDLVLTSSYVLDGKSDHKVYVPMTLPTALAEEKGIPIIKLERDLDVIDMKKIIKKNIRKFNFRRHYS